MDGFCKGVHVEVVTGRVRGEEVFWVDVNGFRTHGYGLKHDAWVAMTGILKAVEVIL
jgi:hypothetical protein